MIILTVISLGVISVYAPAATKKKPICMQLIKQKIIMRLLFSLTLFIITLIIKEPFAQFIQLGIIIKFYYIITYLFETKMNTLLTYFDFILGLKTAKVSITC